MKLSVRGDHKRNQATTSSNIIEFSASQATRYRMDDFASITRKPHSVVFLFVFAFPFYQEHKHIIVNVIVQLLKRAQMLAMSPLETLF